MSLCDPIPSPQVPIELNEKVQDFYRYRYQVMTSSSHRIASHHKITSHLRYQNKMLFDDHRIFDELPVQIRQQLVQVGQSRHRLPCDDRVITEHGGRRPCSTASPPPSSRSTFSTACATTWWCVARKLCQNCYGLLQMLWGIRKML
jgi:hypothetical protein